jgi:glycosyltransferase involved in cell wall biosynthesis
LLLGGDGELETARQRAVERGVSSHVEILGWVRGEDKRRLLEYSTVYVLPSYNEGLPMSVLEAMAYGLPVVTTSVGGIPEAITDGVEGFLIDAGDVHSQAERLVLLLDDPELSRRMGELARRKAELIFSVECIVPQLENIYKQLGVLPHPHEFPHHNSFAI